MSKRRIKFLRVMLIISLAIGFAQIVEAAITPDTQVLLLWIMNVLWIGLAWMFLARAIRAEDKLRRTIPFDVLPKEITRR